MRFFVLALCLFLLLPGASSASDPLVVEQIIAKVNADIVTMGDLEEAREMMMLDLLQQCRNEKKCAEDLMAKRDPDVLRDKIDQTLLVQRAKDLNISVDSQVSKEVAQMQTRMKITDPEEFRRFIERELRITLEDYREKMRQQMLQQEVIGQEVGSKIIIPRSELEKYYEEHKSDFHRDKESVALQEILVAKRTREGTELSDEELKAKTDGIHARAKRGEKFDQLAQENSDAVSAQEGGFLGYLAKGELNAEIEKTVFSLDKGAVTDPIKVPNGFIILKVADKVSPGLQPLAVVENEIMGKLWQPRFQPAIRTYLSKLRQEAFLEIREGFVDSGAVSGKDTAWKDPAELKPETVSKDEVAAQPRRKRLLWMIPIPGTTTSPKSTN
ncbi:MAG: peptidylprolyl isomerase [Bryobacterales bacterium]|jgi:parvulin-like peptidyl-prolyl isomerase|nr:peptidylprolyl isomerase [Bryobacterales bacterium]